MAAEDTPASGSFDRPEARLLAVLRGIAEEMDRAVALSAAIGPEWENVVVDIQIPLLDQLLELSKRLQHRLETADREQYGVKESLRGEGDLNGC